LRALQPVLEVPGVLVVGSEVPNLLQPDAASTLVVSEDVDIGIPVDRIDDVRNRLILVKGLRPSTEEPSVWVPVTPTLIEANFLGIDPNIREPAETYVKDDPELPLLVFGTMGHIQQGTEIVVAGIRVPLPRTSSLLIEKLLTDRTAEKGVRDLLVVAGLLTAASEADIEEFLRHAWTLSAEGLHVIRSNLTVLSLIAPVPSMPDPIARREQVASLLAALEMR
jgi:hypothetical protein